MPAFLYLAPMRGFTTALYRNLYIKHFDGVNAAIAPFIPTLSQKQINTAHIRDILPENNHGMPVIPQILSNDPKGFIELAGVFFDYGYTTVNWNLGCPFPMVAKKNRGSGLLPHPERIDAFLDKVLAEMRARLSIKLRLGREKTSEILQLIPILNRYPLSEIIIHPRTGVQMYTGAADLDAFAACLPRLNAPVVYNGDIFDLPSFYRLCARFPAISRWMIGRGPLCNPFLPAVLQSGNEEITRPVERFKKFHDDLFTAYREEFSGPAHLVNRMKGYWQYFAFSFSNGHKLFKRIKMLRSAEKYIAETDRFFEQEAIWQPNLIFK
ncbi:MAG: tRNA-dihydrouridine synthase family protein [Desulfobacterales bacterium]|jgi:tRNA-dihydrouridine synthase|nr:tRNA-dihydrouridine synthase family protein [Desulfobacterales bacterium]